MYNNKSFLIISISALTTVLLLSLLNGSAFAQSGEEVKKEKEIMNPTIQDISKSTNQPIQNATQTPANETGEAFPIQKNVTDLGANITEGAKDIVGNIGEGLQDLTK